MILQQHSRLFRGVAVGGFACIVLLTLLVHACHTDSKPVRRRIANTSPPDAAFIDDASKDTTEESLDAVAVEYKKTRARVKQVEDAQTALANKQADALRALREQVQTLTDALKSQQAMQATITALQAQVHALQVAQKDRATAGDQSEPRASASHASVTPKPVMYPANTPPLDPDTPIGLVPDISQPIGTERPAYPAPHRVTLDPTAPRKPPAGATKTRDAWPEPAPLPTGQPQSVTHVLHDADSPDKDSPDQAIPYYTLPANATGLDAQLMTALVGRIPVKGHVQDPYPFKIILGPKNLAANGLMLPGVSGMVVAGFAVGDLTLRSVKGWITSVTFVFPDGRIHTVSASAGSHGLPSQTDSLGYLSDPYGNPFLPGRLITNAPAQVGTQLLLSAAEGAAGALATSALPTATGPPTNPSLTGVPSHWSHWLLGHSAQEATHDIRDWWQSRSQGAFDAIYVPAGRDVVINFTRQIPIDYHPNGRKLRYDHTRKILHASTPIRIHPDAVGLD